MNILTKETKDAWFWYDQIRRADSDEARVRLAQHLAGLFALVDGEVEEEVETKE